MKTIDIVFDGPPAPTAGRFIEVEDESGKSISFGEWIERDDGYWALRIDAETMLSAFSQKEVYVAWTQSDLTEGRGSSYPLAICESESTAIRLGHKQYVQGTNCPVTKEKAIRLGHQWLAPGRIIPPSKQDDAGDERRSKRNAAITKAKEAGLSDADIAVITDGDRQ